MLTCWLAVKWMERLIFSGWQLVSTVTGQSWSVTAPSIPWPVAIGFGQVLSLLRKFVTNYGSTLLKWSEKSNWVEPLITNHMVHKEVWGSEPLVQVPSVPEHEPPHGDLVQGFAGPDPEPWVRFRFEPGSRGSRTGPASLPLFILSHSINLTCTLVVKGTVRATT